LLVEELLLHRLAVRRAAVPPCLDHVDGGVGLGLRAITGVMTVSNALHARVTMRGIMCTRGM
jgi:hypothetical protein